MAKRYTLGTLLHWVGLTVITVIVATYFCVTDRWLPTAQVNRQ